MKFFNEVNWKRTKKINLAEHYITEAKLDQNKINVFLSHSSLDRNLLETVVDFFQSYPNVEVYTDKSDEDLPLVTSDETAEKLKEKIQECQKFVILITENTPQSKWIPWELGLADMAKTNKNIALFPYSRKTYNYLNKQEYLGLYDRIVFNNFKGQEPEWLVKYRFPKGNGTATRLEDWLKKGISIIND